MNYDGLIELIPMNTDLPQSSYPPTSLDPEISGYSVLLWAELNMLFKKAKLSPKQSYCMHKVLSGLTHEETAQMLGCSKSSVDTHCKRAITKLNGVPHRGLITAVVEEFGWVSVSDHLGDILK